ncbi:hypothetical protein PHJA_000070200 [Phtheirospermum japonicum]|uniref:Uncharacterized protein n=1 Tax=Phtheirospermum japonicum TaxID=374723 RepID=A0A830AXY1_9LAMI|nr:hypothetical protein PHJA_000070200 [Phtheirospermum japonicum]
MTASTSPGSSSSSRLSPPTNPLSRRHIQKPPRPPPKTSACDAGLDIARKLLVFEFLSFSFFLFSSLVAQGLRLAINFLNSKDVDEIFQAHINQKMLRFEMLDSTIGSMMGCLFLMMSMVNVIQIRLRMLSYGSKSMVHTVTALIVLVTSALVVYISTAVYDFLH